MKNKNLIVWSDNVTRRSMKHDSYCFSGIYQNFFFTIFVRWTQWPDIAVTVYDTDGGSDKPPIINWDNERFAKQNATEAKKELEKWLEEK